MSKKIPCAECNRFEECTNPAKETRGSGYIGCASGAPVVVGDVSDILDEVAAELEDKLASTGYVLLDMWLKDNKEVIVRFVPNPA